MIPGYTHATQTSWGLCLINTCGQFTIGNQTLSPAPKDYVFNIVHACTHSMLFNSVSAHPRLTLRNTYHHSQHTLLLEHTTFISSISDNHCINIPPHWGIFVAPNSPHEGRVTDRREVPARELICCSLGAPRSTKTSRAEKTRMDFQYQEAIQLISTD